MYLAKTDSWYLERVIWLLAGLFTLLSVVLTVFVSPYWLLFTVFVGANLVVFAFTGFCIMANILNKLGIKSRIKP